MKKILMLFLLLVNLQLITDKGTVYIGLGALSAQTMLEEQLDNVTVYGSAWTTCDQCKGDVLKCNLESHKQWECPARTEECPNCHQSYRACDVHVCSSEDRCSQCGFLSSYCICSNSGSSGGVSGSSGSGSSGGGSSGSGNQDKGDDTKAEDRWWQDKDNCLTVEELKNSRWINTLDYLPDNFVPQEDLPDCVARAFATAIYLLSHGDMDQYKDAYSYACCTAYIYRRNFSKNGLEPSRFAEVLGDAFNIKTLAQNEYTTGMITSYLDRNLPVITSIDTELDIPNKYQGVHAVTIVGYDSNYFYCAYGGTGVVRIPQSEIGKYSVYVTTGFN